MGPQAKMFILELGQRLRQQMYIQAEFQVLPPAEDLNGHSKGKHCGHDGFFASGEGSL